MKALTIAALALAGYVVYRRSAAPPPPPPGGVTGGTGERIGGLVDSLVANVKSLTSNVQSIAGSLAPKPIDGSVNDAPGTGYTTRTDARGTTYARLHTAVLWPNDSEYVRTLTRT